MRRIIPTLIAILALTAVVPAGAKPKHKNTYPSDQAVTVECRDAEQGDLAGTISYNGPTKLWPPNHKYATATVTAADEDAGDDVTLTTTGTHDQYDGDSGEEINGSGNTADDITPAAQTEVAGTGSATQTFQIRAERSGRLKQGRTYTITADAMFSDSDGDGSSEQATPCHAEFTIVVPHDMRPTS